MEPDHILYRSLYLKRKPNRVRYHPTVGSVEPGSLMQAKADPNFGTYKWCHSHSTRDYLTNARKSWNEMPMYVKYVVWKKRNGG